MSDLSKDLRQALDDPERYEWGEGPWEHLGDAERDVRRLLDEIEAAEAALADTRRALEQVLDCKGAYKGTISERGGEPAICTKCAATARRALAATDSGT